MLRKAEQWQKALQYVDWNEEGRCWMWYLLPPIKLVKYND